MAKEIEDIILQKLLSPLSRITPDMAYMTRSKTMIALRSQEAPTEPLRVRFMSRIFESMTLTAGLALASLLVVIALGSISYINGSRSGQVAASFNNDSLALETKSADFNFQIQDIGYFDESAKQVTMALDKISKTTDEIKN